MSGVDLTVEALGVARRLLEVHEHVQMDTPEDKALHAEVCATSRMAIDVIEERMAKTP